MEKRIEKLQGIKKMSIVMLVLAAFIAIGSVLLALGLIPFGEQRSDGSFRNDDLTIMDYPLAITGIVILAIFGGASLVIQIIILVLSIVILTTEPKKLSLVTAIFGLFGAGLITLILSIMAINEETQDTPNKVTTN